MSALRALVTFLDSLNEWIGRVVSWLVVIMVLNVFLVVALRYVFSLGWVWMQELYVWTHATVFLLGAGYTLLHDGHVRIDLIYGTASRKYKAAVNLFGCVCFGFPLIYLIFDRSLPMISRSWGIYERSSEVGGLPGLFLFKTVIAVFAVFFGLQLLALSLRSLLDLFGGAEYPDNKGAAA